MNNKVIYHDTVVDQGRGNPCIEALNPPLSDKELTKLLFTKPPFNKPEPKLPSHLRRQELSILNDVYAPFAHVIRLVRSYDDTLRSGYASRNPLVIGYWNEEKAAWVDGSQKRRHQAVTGINFTGEAGLGKSLLVEKATSLHPQVIRHSVYEPPSLEKAMHLPGLELLKISQAFPHVQLTYLTVICQSIRTPKAMAKAIFSAADEALGSGSDYKNEYGKGGIQELQDNAYRLARNHSLGMLLVDEVQRLKNCPETFEFLVNLNNVMKVPIMLIGNDDISPYIELNPSLARRGNSEGDHKWQRIDWRSEEGKKLWKFLMRTLWPYQVLRDVVELTDELCEEFWQGAKGIPDYAVKLFRLAQYRAMDSKVEKITPGIVRSSRDCIDFSKLLLDDPDEFKRRRGKST